MTPREVFEIVVWDQWYDMPLRGIITSRSEIFAFIAKDLEQEPPEFADHPGTYSQLKAFPCGEDLMTLFQRKKKIFREWRARFDRGEVATSTHPLLVDAEFQRIADEINQYFNRQSSPAIEQMGLLWSESGRFFFECSGSLST